MAMTLPMARGVQPLNPALYAMLEHKFGTVQVHNAGCKAQFERRPDPFNPGQTRKEYYSHGEYYAICCPFCKESGFRLWVNHLYGEEFRENTMRRSNTHLAICYRNECLKQPGLGRQFEDLVFGPNKRALPRMPIRMADPETSLIMIEPPGEIVPLTDLPAEHPAMAYLYSREFDPTELTDNFNVGVCVAPDKDKFRLVKNRIYIPVMFNGRLAGWQARSVGDESYGPKYYNSPGMQKSRTLYNYDTASKQPLVVVVEGVPSVWRIGAPAVCLFGKSMSYWQRTTIATTWAGKPVFFLLDSDAHIELDRGVIELCEHDLQVIPVILPDKRDPADYTRAQLKDLLGSAADAVGVAADLSFLDR
jgi:DNA primase catalytic core, N-terminal domain